jgi:hypothetical protein
MILNLIDIVVCVVFALYSSIRNFEKNDKNFISAPFLAAPLINIFGKFE